MKNKSKIKRNFTVSVVIPTFNGVNLLKNNLQSIVDAMNAGGNNIIEIIVVDDGSSDGTVDYMKKYYPQVKLIKHKINRGVTAAMNTGARSTKGSLIALINNDVKVESNFLVHVLPHFYKKDLFAVSLHERGYSWARGKFVKGFVEHEPGLKTKTQNPTFWVNGGSGVFRRKYWMRLKGMDEELYSPYYWEDVDICYRAAKRGWLLIWEPRAMVTHKHESTTSKISKSYRDRILGRNQLIFLWKNITSQNLFRKHIFGLIGRLSRHPGYLIIVVMALAKLGAIMKARSIEKKESKVADEVIFAKFS
jgi:GT2 family glycosyltransferase